MADQFSYVDINEIIRDIKEKYKLYPEEDVTAIILKNVKEGFNFNGHILKAVADAFFNPLMNKKINWFHFICDVCGKKAKKLYIVNGAEVKCRKCSHIRYQARVNTQADRILSIQRYLSEIYSNRDLSFRQKNRMIEYIVTHYNALENKYKMAYNTFVFQQLKLWCVDTLKDQSKDIEYRRAIRDVLSLLKDSKSVLTKTGLVGKKDI